ncbi:diguanylate cyclase [Nocardia sp. BSTN01]|uniref:diguanylate cyclase domain-containing protein n=1 Tax=Nocardia sp. BSTN01 TaxID=2783665 RepID=UPI00188E5984|nr:diguanylate cyclase [Nocardia sp. BSTN01]MBF5000526.1 diguanylate cyclase [Nocardia sp. BSTN01]
MDDIEEPLARAWLKALAPRGAVPQPAPSAQFTLRALIMDLLGALRADPFDASAGVQVGRALVAAQWTDEHVPRVSARVLHRLVDHCPHPDATARIAELLSAIGQGHQAGLCDLRSLDHTHTTPEREADPSRTDDWFRLVFDNIAAAVAIGNTEGTLLQANNALAEMIGVPAQSLQGISIYDFSHPEDKEHIHHLLFETLVPARSGTVKLERRLVRADGTIGWIAFAITYVQGAGESPDYLLAVGSDVTEQHQRHEELHRQARHDPLTGLPNRRLLTERVHELIATAHPGDRAGFCFIDLDHFKTLNDQYGHHIGDKALAAVAARLRRSVRDQHCLVTRIGGDEFVVCIPPPTNTSSTSDIADRLLSALEDPIVIDGHTLAIAASIGVIVTSLAGADTESLLAAADASLYNAKSNGKGHWVLKSVETLP